MHPHVCVRSALNTPTLQSDTPPELRWEHPCELTCSLSTLLFSSSARRRSSSSFRLLSSSSSRLFSSCSLLRCSRSCCLLASRSLLCCYIRKDRISRDLLAMALMTVCVTVTINEGGSWTPFLLANYSTWPWAHIPTPASSEILVNSAVFL